jgi:hypothetical protein
MRQLALGLTPHNGIPRLTLSQLRRVDYCGFCYFVSFCWTLDPCTNADIELAMEQLQTNMNLSLQVTKIDCLVGRKYARDLNIVICSIRSFQNLTSVIHINQQHFRLYNMNDKPYY